MRETGRRKNRDTEVLRDGKPGGGKNGGKQGEWGEERTHRCTIHPRRSKIIEGVFLAFSVPFRIR